MLWVNTVNTHPVEPQISCEMVHTEYCHILIYGVNLPCFDAKPPNPNFP